MITVTELVIHHAPEGAHRLLGTVEEGLKEADAVQRRCDRTRRPPMRPTCLSCSAFHWRPFRHEKHFGPNGHSVAGCAVWAPTSLPAGSGCPGDHPVGNSPPLATRGIMTTPPLPTALTCLVPQYSTRYKLPECVSGTRCHKGARCALSCRTSWTKALPQQRWATAQPSPSERQPCRCDKESAPASACRAQHRG